MPDIFPLERQIRFLLFEVCQTDSEHLCRLIHRYQFGDNDGNGFTMVSKMPQLRDDLPVFWERYQIGFGQGMQDFSNQGHGLITDYVIIHVLLLPHSKEDRVSIYCLGLQKRRCHAGKSVDFFGLPIGQIAFSGIEIDSDDMDLSFVQQVFLEIFFLLDLSSVSSAVRHAG